MGNNEIRKAARIADVRLWEIAKFMGISEPTMTRKLRCEMNECEKEKFIEAINEISRRKETSGGLS